MKNTHYILIFIILFFCDAKSQNITKFYYEMHQADLLFEKENADSALIIYEREFEKFNFIHTKNLNKALKVAKSKKK